jgi:hypothetical protein
MAIHKTSKIASDVIIVILGAYNNAQGELSEIAISRLNKGIEVFKKHKEAKIILTGGCGDHFNPTSIPHAFYYKQYLLSKNIPNEVILNFVDSKFTLEDAMLTKKITDKLTVRHL